MGTVTKIIDHKQYKENPFIPDAVDSMQVKRRTQMVGASSKDAVHLVVNQSTGEINGHSAFMRIVEVDESRFAKLYLAELGALWELGKPAIRVFTYIATCLIPNKDRIFFDLDDCMKYTGYKNHRSVFSGLSQLIDHGILARTTKHWQYFINPMIVFNGSRVTFAKTYVKKKKEADPNQMQLELNPNKTLELPSE